jgi:hypothetical protein
VAARATTAPGRDRAGAIRRSASMNSSVGRNRAGLDSSTTGAVRSRSVTGGRARSRRVQVSPISDDGGTRRVCVSPEGVGFGSSLPC